VDAVGPVPKTAATCHRHPDRLVMPSVRSPDAAALQFVGFELDGQQYLFRIERIQEIITPARVTRLPEVPAYVLGVSNLRGTIIPVIDLRLLFGLPARPLDADSRTIVVVVGSRTVGCTVDAVSHVIRLAADQLKPATDAVTTEGPHYVAGFARIGDDIAIVLDVDQLLDPALLERVHHAGLPPAPDRLSSDGTTAR
jgi:purine-binding chemotaxis protein CheW